MTVLTRRAFLKGSGAVAAAQALGGTAAADGKKGRGSMSQPGQDASGRGARMPVLFVGHGSPMNAIEDNAWSRGFRGLAKLLPRPGSILAISAHWYVAGTFATANERPETIHDFGGFPDELYRIQYPAPGSLDLARRAVALVGEERAALRTDWGLDHGTWSVLMHAWPGADIPVVQLSIDGRLPPAEHLAIGRRLAPLREEGVLVMGSGNVTHNLRHAFSAWGNGDRSTPDWASRFDEGIASALAGHDAEHLTRAMESDAGRLAHPTPDHYLPLLYVAGASDAKDPVRFPISGFDLGSLSMRSVILG
ncbi:MAG: Extradiol ring-cleavage dioxygenase class protein subunit [Anaeromyxobacteraceae bacterium]|nr:Extradiol ring-cleavage dioxygenase class protein subunit [Anaeromyxobacteraceae bacterium]